jgi:hypothetical protein
MVNDIAMSPSLRDAAVRHWRSLIYMWLFPVVAFASWLILGVLGALATRRGAILWFALFELPLFWFAGYKSRLPLREGSISRLQAVVLTMAVPFAIWVIFIFLSFGLLSLIYLLGGANAS